MENRNYEEFDARVDKFLRNEMSDEEAGAFKDELSSDEDKMERARIIALMIKSMDKASMETEPAELIKTMNEEQFRKVAGLKPRVAAAGVSCERCVETEPAGAYDYAACQLRAAGRGERRCGASRQMGMYEAQSGEAAAVKPHAASRWLRAARYAAAACVAVLLIFGGMRYYGYRQTVALGEREYSVYTPCLSSSETYSRGVEADIGIAIELSILFNYVEQGENIGSTIVKLEGLYERAVEGDGAYSDYVDDIGWNLAMAYLKNGERSSAVSILRGMVEGNRGYWDVRKAAEDLIKKIEEL